MKSQLCTKQDDVERATTTLFSALKKRGYDRTFLRSIKMEVERGFEDREWITRVEHSKNLVPLVTNFSSAALILNSYVKTTFERLQSVTDLLLDFIVCYMWPSQCPVCVSSVSALLCLPELRCGQSPEQVKGGSSRAALSLITGVVPEGEAVLAVHSFAVFPFVPDLSLGLVPWPVRASGLCCFNMGLSSW